MIHKVQISLIQPHPDIGKAGRGEVGADQAEEELGAVLADVGDAVLALELRKLLWSAKDLRDKGSGLGYQGGGGVLGDELAFAQEENFLGNGLTSDTTWVANRTIRSVAVAEM